MEIVNTFGRVLGRAIQSAAWAVELAHEIADHPFQNLPVQERETLVTDGPDDLWPEDEYCRLTSPELSDVSATSQPQAVRQWGLRLPNGEVHWNAWQGIGFVDPLDRVKMAATLQKTALDIGLAEGEQADGFLANYQWVTRNVIYEDTGVYSLTDPCVSALDAPESSESPHASDHSSPACVTSSNGHHPDLGLCPGPVGGDAS